MNPESTVREASRDYASCELHGGQLAIWDPQEGRDGDTLLLSSISVEVRP